MKQKVLDTLACSSIAWLTFIMVMELHFAGWRGKKTKKSVREGARQ